MLGNNIFGNTPSCLWPIDFMVIWYQFFWIKYMIHHNSNQNCYRYFCGTNGLNLYRMLKNCFTLYSYRSNVSIAIDMGSWVGMYEWNRIKSLEIETWIHGSMTHERASMACQWKGMDQTVNVSEMWESSVLTSHHLIKPLPCESESLMYKTNLKNFEASSMNWNK